MVIMPVLNVIKGVLCHYIVLYRLDIYTEHYDDVMMGAMASYIIKVKPC